METKDHRFRTGRARLIASLITAAAIFGAASSYSCAARQETAGPASTADKFNETWRKKIEKGDYDSAEKYCKGFQGDPALEVDVLVCLANVEFGRGSKSYIHMDALKMGLGPGESGSFKIENPEDIFSEKVEYDPERIDAALSHLDRALQLDPSRVDIWKGKAYMLRVSGRHQDLIVHIKEMADGCPAATREDLQVYAQEYAREGRYGEAEDLFKELVKIYPDDFIVWSDYGAVVGLAGDMKRSRELMLEAHRRGEDDMLLSNLANVNIYLERFKDALPYLREIHEKYPDDTYDCYKLLLATAVVDMEKAKSMARSRGVSGDAWLDSLIKMVLEGISREDALDMAASYFDQEEHELALLAATLAGDDPEALYYKAGVFSRIGYFQREIEVLEGILAAPGDIDREMIAQLESNLGTAFFQTGRYAEALDHYDRAIEGGLARSNVYYMKGRTLFALGRRPEARTAFKRVIEMNDNPEIVGWSKQYIYWIDEK